MAIGDILVDVQAVAKHYGDGETRVDALRQVDLQVRAGEVIALLGPSGSGKTTLLNIIGCILDPSSGRVMLDGEPVFDGKWLRSDLRRLRLDKIGFIFQAHNLLPFLTAAENVSLVLDLAGWAPEKGKERAKELLDYLEVGHRAPVKPALLSGGEAQRVKLAFFLSKASPNKEGGTLFIFDEPTTGLHFHDIKKLMKSFDALIAQGNTVLCIEHNLDVVKCADWIVDLGPEAGNAGGELVFQGIPEDMVNAKNSITAPYLLEKLQS